MVYNDNKHIVVTLRNRYYITPSEETDMIHNKFKLRKLIIFILLPFAIGYQSSVWATDDDNQNQTGYRSESQAVSPVSPDEDTVSSRTPAQQQLDRDEIKRFVTAMALVKQYYIKNVNDKTLFSNAIQGLISNLDPHSAYLDTNDLKDLKTTVSGEFVGIGIELTSQDGVLKVISPLEGTPADKAGIKPNDLIIKIDGQLVQNMSLRDAVNRIKGKRGSQVTLTVIRKGTEKPLTIMATRDVVKIQTVKSKMLENGYGYIRITFFQGPVDQLLSQAIGSLKSESGGRLRGIVLDLRNNPGGLLDESAKVVDMLLDHSKTEKYHNIIVYTKGRIPGADIKFRSDAKDKLGGIPMVVLINGGSASASEIVAGALQDYKRALIVGTRSFGKGSVQTVFPLSSDTAIKLTTALYYTPAGRTIQTRGIEPDVSIPELDVTAKKTDEINIDESDFQNHLLNADGDDGKVLENQREALQKLHESEIKIAKTDYQLYEALMILKGMNSIH